MTMRDYEKLREQPKFVGMSDFGIDVKLHDLEEVSTETLVMMLHQRGWLVTLVPSHDGVRRAH